MIRKNEIHAVSSVCFIEVRSDGIYSGVIDVLNDFNTTQLF
mgnify:CR=1 FL=1